MFHGGRLPALFSTTPDPGFPLSFFKLFDRSSTTDQRSKKGASFRFICNRGIRKAWSGALWMYKILIPISFLTLILETSQLLERMDGLLAPVMNILHLPAKAALPLVAGLLTGIYGGIASMAVLDFTVKEATLIAVFLLISHALIQESAIQGRSGIHPLKVTAYRLSASVVVVWLIGYFWQGGTEIAGSMAAVAVTETGFTTALKIWCIQTVKLCIQILAILMGIMVIMEWMKASRVSERIVGMLGPLLKLMGLSERAGLLWLTAALFGISYGGAVIVEETRNGGLSGDELERLHLSIGINHAMIEDSALFLPMGIHPLWLWGPRLLAAVLAVQLFAVFRILKPASTAQTDQNPRAAGDSLSK